MPNYPQGRDQWRWWKEVNNNNARIECKIVNETKHTWHWEDFRLQEFSNFSEGPDGEHEVKKEIRPGDSTELVIISQLYMHGCEAWVTYSTPAGPIEFHWNVPYVGANSYHTYKLPDEYISVHNSGDYISPGVGWDPNGYGKYGRERLGGLKPRFQWTIRQRETDGKLTARTIQDHFYTIDANGELAPQAGYKLEGVCGYVYPSSVENAVPLYRYYHPGIGDHFYTQSSNAEGAADWKFEKVECYLPTSGENGAVVLQRWWNNSNDHFYTTHPEGEIAAQIGYHKEPDAGFIYPTQVSGTVPLYRWFLQTG